MKIALASPGFPSSMDQGLSLLDAFIRDAALKQAEIVCFPESFLPGYPGMGYAQADRTEAALQQALIAAQAMAKNHHMALILPMDSFMAGKLYNLAYVISAEGRILGYQTKNQLDPSEDTFWTPGHARRLFTLGELRFGITICHEGFRYPESVRWSAYHGAQLVFHPHCNGSNRQGVACKTFLATENPYYEKAMMMRALENGVYFASVNYSSRFQESASAVFAPDGTCLAHQPYGQATVTVADIEPDSASGLYAKRFKPGLLSY